MGFLELQDKTILVAGAANRKSVAYFVANLLIEEGATVVLSVRDEEVAAAVRMLYPDHEVLICDVEDDAAIERLATQIRQSHGRLDGFVHSIAFADFSRGLKPFHETTTEEFLQAVNISCFSLTKMTNAFKDLLAKDASVVTISISTTRMASENYGYMAPVKAALDSSIAFLAKSFSQFSEVRFNSVNPALLKTSASAGIPGYLDAYLFAETAIPRKRALKTKEVANVVAFLLSPRASGINAQHLVVDAGMSINYFDEEIVRKVTNPE